MRRDDLDRQFGQVRQAIGDAMSFCHERGAPSETLRRCIEDLDREADELSQVLRGDASHGDIVAGIDRMESMGDRALGALRQEGPVHPDLLDAVRRTHDELSRLKHQLH
ncbi:MAG TPA: hypothetical protein VEY50_07005 [Lysobacter sp.]|nr:hypothetical protein [Lysobacter sp.]